MHRKVAVEKNLHNVKEYFEKNGYQVDLFRDGELDTIAGVSNYDAIIVAGENVDFLGYEDTRTKAPVIEATGMTPEEIFDRVSEHKIF